eukprot:TRINITY_DN21337_c0_g1_i1.p1 TRINITY_DN21337_c0_g1~~TRINITY_DN21337_c0_g1_i1.p1  ORF type:complete len:196 (+),score=36.61 TRINITY_DN21337_c0_g1_i1:46-633(+)
MAVETASSHSALLERFDPRLADLDDSELQRLRAVRISQLQREQEWRQSGQGKLRELADEVDFLEVLQPRERGVCLICDRTAESSSDLLDAFEELARRHVETQVCHLEFENAGLLAHAVDLDGGLPVVFVVHCGKVAASFSPAVLFEKYFAESPRFQAHLTTLLRNAGGLSADAALEDEDSDADFNDSLGYMPPLD